jgi:hypothetical protein
MISLVFVAVIITGCVDSDRLRLLTGPGVEINGIELQTYRANQDVVVQNLVALAGYTPGLEINDWRPVVDAGIAYVHQRCQAYIDALFWFNRYKNTTVSQISLLGAGTASALGIVQASAREIALVALAFGVTAQSIEVLSSSILYKIDPSAVKSLVEASQGTYLRAIAPIRYTTRPTAMSAIQGYLNLCLPATLEAQVMAAVHNATFTGVVPAGPQPTDVVPQIKQNVPPPSQVEAIPFNPVAPDRAALEEILLYNAQAQTYDPKRIALMRMCWRELSIPVHGVAEFLAKAEFANRYRDVTACIQRKLNAGPPVVPSPKPQANISKVKPPPPPVKIPVDPKLLTALKYNAEKNEYDPHQVTLAQQCFGELKIAVPSASLGSFIGEQKYRRFDQAVAACISSKQQ